MSLRGPTPPGLCAGALRPVDGHGAPAPGRRRPRRQATLALHPIGRLGTADDIAKGIVFLASDDASFMTGAGLVVDGGWTAH